MRARVVVVLVAAALLAIALVALPQHASTLADSVCVGFSGDDPGSGVCVPAL